MEGGAAGTFSVQVDHPAGTAVVARVHGDLDAVTAPRLRATIADLVTATQHRLVLDLDGVRFLATAGLGVLIDARQARPDLQIVCSNPRALRVLEITGLLSWFHVTPTVAAALADDATNDGLNPA